jgi:tRNA 2-selenouridine synthase
LIKEYASFEKVLLAEAIGRIQKRMGSDKAQLAFKALENNDFEQVADLSLTYYDKAYLYGLSAKKKAENTLDLPLTSANPKENAQTIIDFVRKHHLI